MKFEFRKSAGEFAVELVAALSLGGAIAVAMWLLLPLAPGGRALAALFGGMAAAGLGLGIVRASATQDYPGFAFESASLAFEDEVLLLDDSVLLLDEPVAPLAGEESRVVRLFVPEPGEMVARIDAFLDQEQGVSRRSGVNRVDASAALHAALAEIRHSLR